MQSAATQSETLVQVGLRTQTSAERSQAAPAGQDPVGSQLSTHPLVGSQAIPASQPTPGPATPAVQV